MTRSLSCLALVGALLCTGCGNDFLLVSDVKNNQVLRFDRSGNFVDVFVTPASGGLEHPIDILPSWDGNGDGKADLIVVSRGAMSEQGAVLRYDGQTGTFVDVFAADPTLDWPHDMTYGPDYNLYVVGVRSDNVVRFDGKTGQFLGEFVAPASGGLDAPHGMAFGGDLDGDYYPELYVGSRDTDEVLVYSGRNGAFLRDFVSVGSGGLQSPHDLLFTRGGDLLVTSHKTDEVLRYDQNGAFVDVFVSAGAGGLTRPHSMDYGPKGDLFVTSVMSDNVLRFSRKTGKFVDEFASGNGLERPHGLVFLGKKLFGW